MIKPEQILQLINQPESPTLEFKQEFYAISDPKQEKKKRQKDELLKDLLALANGSIETVGETSYLIVGIADEVQPDGTRKVIGAPFGLPDANMLLQMLRQVSDPPVSHLNTEYVPVGDKQVYVITIPFSPHLHETRRLFETSGCEYSQYAVFIRRNSMVELANNRERKALEDLKTFRSRQKSNLSNTLVGGVVGALVMGPVAGKNAEKLAGKPINKYVSWGTGLFFGGLSGALTGYNLRRYHEIVQELRFSLMRRKRP